LITNTPEQLQAIAEKAFADFMEGFHDGEIGKPSSRTDELYMMGRERAQMLLDLEAERIG